MSISHQSNNSINERILEEAVVEVLVENMEDEERKQLETVEEVYIDYSE